MIAIVSSYVIIVKANAVATGGHFELAHQVSSHPLVTIDYYQ